MGLTYASFLRYVSIMNREPAHGDLLIVVTEWRSGRLGFSFGCGGALDSCAMAWRARSLQRGVSPRSCAVCLLQVADPTCRVRPPVAGHGLSQSRWESGQRSGSARRHACVQVWVMTGLVYRGCTLTVRVGGGLLFWVRVGPRRRRVMQGA
ncbi:hypothetical protein NDU88_005891 [Pleurodeles waltl]|uniref:Uncharacterized protein n=1 Tax=Pleurodeles waltl TaxID=8319 RepID=A0AAV7MAN9_PLEWA|nr:hypothetical protein NDU88_005891 [Pleurodeles waltl]